MSEKSGLKTFFVIAGSLFALRVLLAYASVPLGLAKLLSVLSALVFIGAPLYAIYRAASHDWSIRTAFKLLVPGTLAHASATLLIHYVLPEVAFVTVFTQAFGQAGILMWTLGLGVLLAIFIRDKNMMIPVAIFLIGFDMFLVFNPSAPTALMMRQGSINAQVVLINVPIVKGGEDVQRGKVEDLAYVGPADLLFSAAFFTLLFRFGMRTRRTLQWLIPVLAAYLGITIFFGTTTVGPLSLAMLPAMVPIGLTVLLVNRKEFKLEKQEKLGVLLVTVMAVAFAWYGVYRASIEPEETEPPPVPLSGGTGQGTPEQPSLPGTVQ